MNIAQDGVRVSAICRLLNEFIYTSNCSELRICYAYALNTFNITFKAQFCLKQGLL